MTILEEDLNMRKLIYYVASTVDGFIAHKDGSLDGFPWDDEFVADLFELFPETIPAHLKEAKGTPAENKWFDVVLMGRKTYEVGLKEVITNPYPSLKQFLFSRTMTKAPDDQVELVSKNAVDLVRNLKQESGKAIWLCGGADLAKMLFEAGLIDTIILKLNPVLFGSGIPLFSGVIKPTNLELTDSKIYGNGVVLLYYRVQN